MGKRTRQHPAIKASISYCLLAAIPKRDEKRKKKKRKEKKRGILEQIFAGDLELTGGG